MTEDERVDHTGDLYDLGGLTPEFNETDPEPPVDVAALGPKTTDMAGRVADGWVPQMFTPDGLRNRLDDLRRGARLAGRTLDDVRVAPVLRCCALTDSERARPVTRRYLTFLLAAYGPFYRETVAKQGLEDVTDEIHDAWQRGDREAALAALPDALLDELAAAGEPEVVRDRLRQFARIDGVDAIRVAFPSRLSSTEVNETLRALAPENWPTAD